MPNDRGVHLSRFGDRFSGGDGAISAAARHMLHPLLHRWIARFGHATREGALHLTLPDGSTRLLQGADNGPVAALTLHNWSALWQARMAGSVGWYRAWLAGHWESPDLAALFAFISANGATMGQLGRAKGLRRWFNRLLHRRRANDVARARENIAAHYDLGNDFYAAWLDPKMLYSSAIFADGDDLARAQERKMDAILARCGLEKGGKLLEIGCGWGALGERAIRHHDVRYTGLTLSEEQAAHARALVEPYGGEIALVDYRHATGTYDAIASVEMVEAVGREYWGDYLGAISRLLRPGGRAAIQYIAMDDAMFADYAANTDFIQTYIFPGGCLISTSEFRAKALESGLDWQDEVHFGMDYAETLRIWREAYSKARATGQLPAGFDAAFDRLWTFYLSYCEGGFRGGGISVAQVTLVKN
ncbi:MAG: class I SAM-dependent methyltransferase [Sphingomonadaceae bacterium]|nr:class I SAM-dependent methyltransferase [Sphingomonadaceae bacterium]